MSDHPVENREPIVITGVGLITPLGLSLQTTWDAIVRGQTGIGPMSAMESLLPPSADGGQAPDLPADFEPHLSRESRYLRYALLAALRDAGVSDRLPYEPSRRGILLGTTLHGMRAGGRFFRSGDFAELRKFLAGSVLNSVAADLGFHGCAATTCSACSSSLGSIAMAITLLRSGQIDFAVAGGYDAISEYVYGGFNSLRLVSPGPLRPFARDRQGMKVAEGYGIVVLERAGDANARGARTFATVLGYGESADAHHLTQPHPQGEGAARAMRQAIASAGLSHTDIDLVAAHATGTPDNDAGEYAAMSRVFAEDLPRVPVVAFKSYLGHTLGGAGAVELILSAKALEEQVIPACANVKREDVDFAGLHLATGTAKSEGIRATLNTSLGFGGANTCLVLGREPARTVGSALHPKLRDVYITGIGTLFPGIVGIESLLGRLSAPAGDIKAGAGPMAENELAPLLNARRVRRMSEYVKQSLAATMLCLRDAGVKDDPAFLENCAAVLGTAHGSTNYCEQYYGQIVREGVAAANPMLFAEGVPNAAAAHLSLMLSLKGPCQTVIGSRTAGLDAIRLAASRIGEGQWERALVGAADEFSQVIQSAYQQCGPGELVTGAGAVTFLLESRESTQSRGAKPRGRVLAGTGGIGPVEQMGRLMRGILDQLGRLVVASSISDRLVESFSAIPLGSLAVALVSGGPGDRLAVIANDACGAASGVSIEIATD